MHGAGRTLDCIRLASISAILREGARFTGKHLAGERSGAELIKRRSLGCGVDRLPPQLESYR